MRSRERDCVLKRHLRGEEIRFFYALHHLAFNDKDSAKPTFENLLQTHTHTKN